MNRKWVAPAATLFSAALVLTGLGLAADDEESPLHKAMEKVQAKNSIITKAVRSTATFSKGQKDATAAAEALVKLGKEVRDYYGHVSKDAIKAEPAKATKENWEKFTDDFVKEAETFAKLMAKSDTKQPQAKNGYKAVSKSCSNCHDIFRKDEE
jgi:cytochrome c556